MKTNPWMQAIAIALLSATATSCSQWGHMDPPAGTDVIPSLERVAAYSFDEESLDPSVFTVRTYPEGLAPQLMPATDSHPSQYLNFDGGYLQVSNPLKNVTCQTAASLTFMMQQPKPIEEEAEEPAYVQDLEGALIGFENENGSEHLFLTANGWLSYKGMDGEFEDNNPAIAKTGFITPGDWHKVALIVRETGYALYVDGFCKVNKVIPDFDCSKMVDFMNQASTLYIGKGSEAQTAAWNVDDVNIYRNEITSSEWAYNPMSPGGPDAPVVDLSTWTLVGADDNTQPFWSTWSPKVNLKGDGTIAYQFYNYSNCQANWNNWVLAITDGKHPEEADYSGDGELLVIRADAWGWAKLWENTTVEHNYNFDTFKDEFDGALIDMEITRTGSTIVMNSVATCTSGAVYNYKATITGVDVPEIATFFTVDGSHLLMNPAATWVGQKFESGSKVTGLTDCSTPWWSAFSDLYTLNGPTKNFCVEFTNNTTGVGANWNNWLVVCTNGKAFGADGYAENYVLRADAWGWGDKYDASTLEHGYDFDNFVADMKGAKCKVFFDYANQTLTMTALQTTEDGRKIQPYTFTTPGVAAPVGIFFTCELAWLDFSRVGYYPWLDINTLK